MGRRHRTAGLISSVLCPVLLALTFVAPALAGPPARPAPATASASIADRIEALLAGVRPPVQLAVFVQDVATDRILYEHGADTPLAPASVMKLLTSAAGLIHLGPDFTWETPFYLVDRELWVIGSGDPGLGDERILRRHGRPLSDVFDTLAARLRQRGVTQLDRIVLDDSRFDHVWRHEDWPPDENAEWYQAPVGAINWNDNCLDAAVRLQAGRVVLTLRPALPGSFFLDRLRPGTKHAVTFTRRPGSDVFEFRGTVARDATLEPVACARPTVFFGHALRSELVRRGIEVAGAVVRRRIDPARLTGLVPLHVERTTMADVLWRVLTFSQNLFAECLIKSLAAWRPDGRPTGTPGNWPDGARIVREAVESLGIPLDGAVIRDGSGLSRRNRITARQVVGLLDAVHDRPRFALLVSNLARPGRPGTMRRRHNTPLLRGHLRGKTGTLSDVRTLAGYVERDDGRVLAFAVLINRGTQDAIATRVAEILVTVTPNGR